MKFETYHYCDTLPSSSFSVYYRKAGSQHCANLLCVTIVLQNNSTTRVALKDDNENCRISQTRGGKAAIRGLEKINNSVYCSNCIEVRISSLRIIQLRAHLAVNGERPYFNKRQQKLQKTLCYGKKTRGKNCRNRSWLFKNAVRVIFLLFCF